MTLLVSAVTILAALVVVVALFLVARSGGGGQTKTFAARKLLTDNELEFLHRLQRAVPQYAVFTQVSMGALLTVRRGAEDPMRARNRFAQKVVDFVVFDPRKNEIVALVELDDRTHSKAKDAERDAMTAEAGYRTLRVDSRAKPSVNELRALVVARARPKTP